MARYLSPSGLAGGHVFGHVPDYISGQIHPHRKLEMLGIARKCVWNHKILHRKKHFFMTYLHVQFNIFFKYKTWEFKANIFPLILWFSNLQNICCGG